ncbi:MAG: hypothetical protein IJU37_03265 [Desulfovibrio sp.]|nr:hypothetical protein [Desulfovibrio sp.]
MTADRSGQKFRKAIVLWDVFENYRDGRRQHPPLKTRNALALSQLLRHALHYGPSLDCAPLPWDQAERLRAVGYATCLGSAARGASYAEWLAVYAAEPSPELVALCAAMFAQRLVIGFYLPPVLCKALCAAGCAWLQLRVYPTRFLQDFPLGLACDNRAVLDFARTQSISEEQINLAAARLAAQYAPDHVAPWNWLYPHSLLVLAPTFYDDPVTGADGHQKTLLAQEDRLRTLAEEYGHVYACASMSGDFTPEERAFLRDELKATFIEPPHFRVKIIETLPDSLYTYISHPAIAAAVGLPSALLSECAWFSKRVIPLIAEGDKEMDLLHVGPLDERCLTPPFWTGIVNAFAGEKADQNVAAPEERLNLRRLFRGAGGDFDDSQSVCLLDNTILIRVMAVEAHLGVSWLVDGLADAYSMSLPPMASKERTYPFAIFAAGDANILPQAVVALRSFGWHLGNANLFYLSGEAEISEEGREFLQRHGIRLLTSQLHHGFAASYRGSPPVAYLQLAGYELLAKEGYAWSLGVQPDVLCLRDFDTDAVFQETPFVAAPANYLWRISYSLRSACQGIAWSPQWGGLDDPGFIPALLFCNHQGLQGMNMLRQAREVFAESGPENLFLNEEAVLHRLQYAHPDFCRRLPDGCAYQPYNHVYHNPWAIHYDSQYKPWKNPVARRTMHEEVLYRVWYRAAKQFLDTKAYEGFIVKHKELYRRYCGAESDL